MYKSNSVPVLKAELEELSTSHGAASFAPVVIRHIAEQALRYILELEGEDAG